MTIEEMSIVELVWVKYESKVGLGASRNSVFRGGRSVGAVPFPLSGFVRIRDPDPRSSPSLYPTLYLVEKKHTRYSLTGCSNLGSETLYQSDHPTSYDCHCVTLPPNSPSPCQL